MMLSSRLLASFLFYLKQFPAGIWLMSVSFKCFLPNSNSHCFILCKPIVTILGNTHHLFYLTCQLIQQMSAPGLRLIQVGRGVSVATTRRDHALIDNKAMRIYIEKKLASLHCIDMSN